MCQNIIPKVLSTTDEEMYREEGVPTQQVSYVCTSSEGVLY